LDELLSELAALDRLGPGAIGKRDQLLKDLSAAQRHPQLRSWLDLPAEQLSPGVPTLIRLDSHTDAAAQSLAAFSALWLAGEIALSKMDESPAPVLFIINDLDHLLASAPVVLDELLVDLLRPRAGRRLAAELAINQLWLATAREPRYIPRALTLASRWLVLPDRPEVLAELAMHLGDQRLDQLLAPLGKHELVAGKPRPAVLIGSAGWQTLEIDLADA
jgi:hypothetical protein